jgi:predicted  nucleic acid-binding Zn-ribbon protein
MPESLAPTDAQHKDELAKHLDAILNIRGYCCAVQSTNFTPAQQPPPDWYKTLAANLALAKEHTTLWTRDLEPAIISTIPQAVIDFGTRFDTAATSIMNILDTSHKHPNADQRTEILDQLTWMTRHLNEQKASIAALHDQFRTFQKDASEDLTRLQDGANGIQAALDLDEQLKNKLQADYDQANADIEQAKSDMTASGIGTGVGMFVGVAVMGLAPPPFGLIAGGLVLVGSIATMAALLAKYSKALSEARNRLADVESQQRRVAAEVTALTVLQKSTGKLVELNVGMGQSMQEIADWWSTLEAKQRSVINDVTDAQDDANHQAWTSLALDIPTAKRAWVDFSRFATNMQDIATGAQVEQQEQKLAA